MARASDELCAPANVDLQALEAYVRKAVGEFVPMLAQQPMVAGQLQIFDFSERKQSNRAAALVPSTQMGGSSSQKVLVTRVGDALQEPFWPEGLGINRGFLHCLDCADMVKGYASLLATGAQLERGGEQMLQRREALFGCTKRVSGYNRQTELKPHLDQTRTYTYSIDPRTRYASLPPSLPAALYG
eukprot:3681056-Prymnesium_polylepis.1